MPLNIALVDVRDVDACGVSDEVAIRAIARQIDGTIGINLFDMDAITTTSDGLVIEGAIVTMAAGDFGTVHHEFGILAMEDMPVTGELVREEPHLAQAQKLYPGRRLFRGPNPARKLIPVHNAVMTGRAVNNNSGTEMMNVVTMEEILLPILGQLQLMRDQPVLFGKTGEHISVGIGMTVAETYGRVFPSRQFRAGDTAHASGKYAKTLKNDIPCIVAPKGVLAKCIVEAFRCGMIPGLHLGCAPALLAAAKALGHPIQIDNITEKALEELASVGMDMDWLTAPPQGLTPEELIDRADALIPGAEGAVLVPAEELVVCREVTLAV